MRVGAEHDIARFGVAHLGHELMADAVAAVYVSEAVFVCESIADLKVTDIFHSAGRNQMVVDEDHLVRVPQLFEAHFFEFLCYKWNENIVNHDPVHIYGDDLTRFYMVGTDIFFDDFFN